MNPYRSDFPIFTKYPKLAYLDNAATTQRPQTVIDSITDFYSYENANVHRGVYKLSNDATQKYEEVRTVIAKFLGAGSPENIGFTKGTTESINIVARSYLQPILKPGDNVVTTMMEHHANFLPWQMVCKQSEAALRVAPLTASLDVDLNQLEEMLDSRTKMLAVNHISNTIGTINPISEIIAMAHQKNIPVLVDAAQSAAYYKLDLLSLNCDFLAFSGHKFFGPFGTGVLYVGDDFRDKMRPFNYGGGMIEEVGLESSSFVSFPYNLDAGTPNVSGVIGFGRAIEYVDLLDKSAIKAHLKDVTTYAEDVLEKIDKLKIIGAPKERSGIFSFTVEDIHPHDVASFLNKDEIAVRAGMHCTQPLMDAIGIPAATRASFSIYNTKEEVDRLVDSIRELIEFWG